MKNFKLALLLSMGTFFFTFLYVQQLYCPRIEVLVLGTLGFLFYMAMQIALLRRWSRPLEAIIDAVNMPSELPRVLVKETEKKNPFTPIARAFNSLSETIHLQMEKSQEKDREMEGILESLSEGVISFDPSGRIVFANQVASSLLQIPQNQLIGHSLSHEGLAKKCKEMVFHILQTSEPFTEKWVKDHFYLDLIGIPSLHRSGVVLVLQDKTTDHKVLEIGKNFIANASHELRTPITVIRGFAEMLEEDVPLPRQKKKEITQKIVSTCERLERLIKSLLALADLEHISSDQFQGCNIVSLMEHCRHFLLAAYPHVEVKIPVVSAEILVQGDFDLLDLAFMNLLENSVKYSNPPASIEISYQIKEGKRVEIELRDRGIGISSADLPHIFDRFYTVDKARSRKSGGAGLGLSLVRSIIEKHRGTISVHSELGKGSVFAISLPVKERF